MKFLIVVSTIFISACSYSLYIPPDIYIFEREKEFAMDKDLIWEKLIDFCAEYNLPIKIMDKNSGFLNTEFRMYKDAIGLFDCGYYARRKIKVDVSGNLTFLVRTKNNKNYLIINNFFEPSNPSFYNIKIYDDAVRCLSTGLFENIIFGYIEGKHIPIKQETPRKEFETLKE